MKRLTFAVTIGLATVGTIGASPVAFAAKAEKVPAVIPTPATGMGQVVFFRPSAMGMAISCNIRENGKMVGTTNNGRYFVLQTTAGVHKYTTKSEATDEINVEVEADETIYVKCKIAVGIVAGRPNLSPSTKEEFDGRSANLKVSDPDKMAKTIAKDDAKRTGK